MSSTRLSANEKGDVGLSAALHYFSKLGYQCSLPIGTDKRPYDLLVEIDGKIRRIQCKYTAHTQNSQYIVRTYISAIRSPGSHRVYRRKPYKVGDFDYMFVLCSDQRQYLIPIRVVASYRSRMLLGLKMKKYLVANGFMR